MKTIKEIYKNISKTSFWICFTISVSLLIISFIIPPTGEISPSVLEAVAEIFAFATLGTVIDAIKKGSDITLKHGTTEVTLNNPEKEEIDEM